MRKFLLSLMLVVLFASSSYAVGDPTPDAPSKKGQWAYSFNSELRLYRRASFDSRYTEVENPEKWISVPSAVRDEDNNLWYKVSIYGKTGWLPQTGVRLKMGGKSELASNLYDKFARKMRKSGERSPYTFNSQNDEDLCSDFFGSDVIGMSMSALRKKLGTPTYRESPDGDITVNWLYYELAGRDMTLTISLYREQGAKEGRVTAARLDVGRTGADEYE
ncbi:MAG: hypothetical protein IJT58_00220 [Synergistaceae bacterium]|nr:hypothetical protein [Synergistaceae bacterium]